MPGLSGDAAAVLTPCPMRGVVFQTAFIDRHDPSFPRRGPRRRRSAARNISRCSLQGRTGPLTTPARRRSLQQTVFIRRKARGTHTLRLARSRDRACRPAPWPSISQQHAHSPRWDSSRRAPERNPYQRSPDLLLLALRGNIHSQL